MEKEIVIIGRECLARKELLVALSLRYNLMTTDIIADFCGCEKGGDVIIRSLSPDEMIACADYLCKISNISAVGYMDGTALFLCKAEGKPIVVADPAMSRLCNDLGLHQILLFGHPMDNSIQNEAFDDNLELITPLSYESLRDFIKKLRL